MLVFNRPNVTQRVFEVVRSCKPSQLYLIADGPRQHIEGEGQSCAEVRAIIENINWPCTVRKNYADKNLGCKLRVSSGLDWVFSEVEEAIILEDDCLPDMSFFRFCEDMLARYRNDDRIGHISGDNFQFEKQRTASSYYFSHHSHVWGWATWRRAWKDYDLSMSRWPLIRNGGWLNDLLMDRRIVSYWENIYNLVYEDKIPSWAYRWNFCNLINGRLSIIPHVNLVTNIGFGDLATNTKRADKTSDIRSCPIEFPLVHPEFIIRDAIADHNTDLLNLPPSRWEKRKKRLLRLFNIASP
jgi:hypothetical protein